MISKQKLIKKLETDIECHRFYISAKDLLDDLKSGRYEDVSDIKEDTSGILGDVSKIIGNILNPCDNIERNQGWLFK